MVQVPVDQYNSVLTNPTPTPFQDELRPQIVEKAFGSETANDISGLGKTLDSIDQANGRAQGLAITTQADLDMQKTMQQAQMSAAPGAPDFTKNIITAHNNYYQDALDGVNNPYAKQYIQQYAQSSLKNYGMQAQSFQANQEVQLRKDNLTSSINNMAQSLSIMSPQDADNQYPMVLQRYTDTINQELLPPAQKSQLIDLARQSLTTAVTQNMIKSNPNGFLEKVNAPSDGLDDDGNPVSTTIGTDADGLPEGQAKVTGLKAFDD